MVILAGEFCDREVVDAPQRARKCSACFHAVDDHISRFANVRPAAALLEALFHGRVIVKMDAEDRLPEFGLVKRIGGKEQGDKDPPTFGCGSKGALNWTGTRETILTIESPIPQLVTAVPSLLG